MIGLDSNLLLRLAIGDDEDQFRRARNELRKLSADRPGYINLIVLAEFCWTLKRAYKVPESGICDAVTRFLGAANLVMAEREAVVQAVLLAGTTQCDFSDALIFAVNQSQGCDHTVTFDRRFAESGAARLADA